MKLAGTALLALRNGVMNMKDIKLEELHESKEFMKHAKIADGLTKETGLEHGFIFCKRNNEIIVDKMCIGDKCSIDISPEECSEHDNAFHVHPSHIYRESEFSSADIYNNVYKAYITKKPHIECVKTATSDIILCEIMESPTHKEAVEIASRYKHREDIWMHTPDEYFAGFVRNLIKSDRKEFSLKS